MAGHPRRGAVAGRRLRHRRAEPRRSCGRPIPARSSAIDPSGATSRTRARTSIDPRARVRGRRRQRPAAGRRAVRRGGVRAGAQLRARRRHAAVAEMVRVARPGGTVGRLRVGLRRRDAADAPLLGRRGGTRPGAPGELDEGVRFPICRPEPLRGPVRRTPAWPSAGRARSTCRPVFRDFDDYWTPFLGGQGPAPGYALSLERGPRAALRERIRAALPVGRRWLDPSHRPRLGRPRRALASVAAASRASRLAMESLGFRARCVYNGVETT